MREKGLRVYYLIHSTYTYIPTNNTALDKEKAARKRVSDGYARDNLLVYILLSYIVVCSCCCWPESHKNVRVSGTDGYF